MYKMKGSFRRVYHRCKNLWFSLLFSLARAEVWLLFNDLSALWFYLSYAICEFDSFLHRR